MRLIRGILMKMKTTAIFLIMTALLSGCTNRSQPPVSTSEPVGIVNYAEGRELMCVADTEQQAREIASLYGMELVDYREGFALFHTEEDPGAVKQRGIDNGWPELEINVVNPLD